MRVRLEYGRDGLEVELPDEADIRVLSYAEAAPLPDPAASLQAVLQSPTGTPALADLAAGRTDACIVICDITRPVPNEQILSPMLETLEQAGIPRDRITILIGTGLHRPNEGDELVEMVGARIAEHFRIENHFGQALDQHTYLGQSPRDVPIWIDSRYVEADLKISVGLIEPHLMAGFSGGRKLICPGIAALDTVKVWHNPSFMEHPAANCGILTDNPVHQENTWIARKAGCDFIVNVVIDAQRRPLKFVAGDMEAAFGEGVDFVRDVVTATVPEPVDIVVTTSAGYPLDATFYQSVKGMTGAAPIVRQGGTIILAAAMDQGIGSPQFRQLFDEHADLAAFMKAIMEPDYFVLDQWQLEKMAQACRKAKVKVVTDGLPSETVDSLFVESASSVERALADSLAEYGSDATVAVIPKGPYVLARVE